MDSQGQVEEGKILMPEVSDCTHAHIHKTGHTFLGNLEKHEEETTC